MRTPALVPMRFAPASTIVSAWAALLMASHGFPESPPRRSRAVRM